MFRIILPIIFCSLVIISCNGGSNSADNTSASQNNSGQVIETPANVFSRDQDYIYKDNQVFNIKGVVYVPGQPGYLPWEIERLIELPDDLKARIDSDLAGIEALGANTIRFWGAPKYCYEVIKRLGGLNILQTIWLDGAASDFQNEAFKQSSKNYIKEVVDRVYSVYVDNNPPIVGFLVGNELSEASILSTNQAHPDINSYSGSHIIASNINATEAFIAEMADYLRTYELDTYGRSSLISYGNEIRTVDLIDTPFLDFRSQNVYSYAVPYYRPNTTPGSTSGTLYQGWIETLKNRYVNIPLLITETGLSVSPNAPRVGPPNYGYGGNTELDQAQGILQNLNDINSASVSLSGVVIHEYLDAWWKFGLEDSYSQDPDDIEEWFGIVRIVDDNGAYYTVPKLVYEKINLFWQENE